jgi:2-polyprenyl-3-methyl-5-hydroxy-6-metoxy-1,4-benzoquinol methylase
MPNITTSSPDERLDTVISGAANPAYVAFHRPRFAFLIETLRPYAARSRGRLLDVGASQLTSELSKQLGLPVDSLGLEPDRETVVGRHYAFDLNDAQHRERWRRDLGPYGIIVFAEVIEHLYTAPELVLAYLRELLVPEGVLLLQTPNAVALRNRVRMALGSNPFERIRADRANPGHFREYTAPELRQTLTEAGFVVEQTWMKYYFDARYARHQRGDEAPSVVKGAVKNLLYRLLPAPLQEGITIVARKG